MGDRGYMLGDGVVERRGVRRRVVVCRALHCGMRQLVPDIVFESVTGSRKIGLAGAGVVVFGAVSNFCLLR